MEVAMAIAVTGNYCVRIMKLTKMSSSDWSELRIEMLELIAKRLDLMHCYRFGATCKSCIFEVYRFVHMSNFKYKWEKVKSIGDYMFLGGNSAFSLSIADFPESEGN
ncbi:hypothetical protein AAC387_Pa03g4325 [Persea americana]